MAALGESVGVEDAPRSSSPAAPDARAQAAVSPAIADLAARCRTLEQRNAENQAQIRLLRAHVARRYAELRTESQRSLETRHELGRVAHLLMLEERNREALQAALAEVNRQFADVVNSTSWRAMHPFRRLAARAPGPARMTARTFRLFWWTATLQLGTRFRLWRANRARIAAPPAPPAPSIPLLQQAATLALPAPLHLGVSGEPEVSILICTYGQAELTLACLRSIAAHPPARPFEILLLDDAAPPGPALAHLAAVAEAAGVRLLRNAENLGFLRSCNAAAASAFGRYLYLLNNDTELQPGAIDALVDLLERRPDAGMAGSKLLYPDGTLQEAGGIVWSDASAWNYGKREDPERPEFNYVRETDYCSGASLMVRRELWERLGGFDEAFAPAYYEDTDLAFRMRAIGLKVLYEPRSVVVHHEGASHGTDLQQGLKAHQVVNQSRMLERWGAVLRTDHYANGEHVLRARDHARRRPVLLAIDHYALEPDRDAGSRSVLGILRGVIEAGWVVKFWPHNQAYNPVYTSELEALGIEVIDQRRAEAFASWIQREGGELDHVLVIRPEVAADTIGPLLRDTEATLSFYGVDLHFARMRRQAAIEDDRTLLRKAELMERLEQRLWRLFDVVIYPSEEEAKVVRAMAPGTNAHGIVPFCFDAAPPRTRVVEPGPAGETTLLFVAGFQHNPNVDAAQFLVDEILPLIEAAVGPVHLVLAGSNPTQAVRALAGPRVRVTGFVTDDELAALYRTARAAVVPLRFGAGVKGKVIEALSYGLPVVTTSIGAQGIEGLREVVPVHDDPPSIAAALVRLLQDDAAWLAQSQAQSAFAEANFSPAAMQRSVLSVLATAPAPA